MQRDEKLSGRSVFNRRRFLSGKPLMMVGGLGLLTALVVLMVMVQSGWPVKAAAAVQAGWAADVVWRATGETVQERQVGGNLPPNALVWQLDEAALQRVLDQALPEGMGALENSPAILPLPLPDGKVIWFRIVDSPVLAPRSWRRSIPRSKATAGRV